MNTEPLRTDNSNFAILHGTALQAVYSFVLETGPDRVVVDEHGQAKSARRAREEDGIEPDVVLVRNDGWTLGATWDERPVAWSLWPEYWVAEIDLDTKRIRTYWQPARLIENGRTGV